jgi:hypothetical protein
MQEIFLADAGDIYLNCHQNHRVFLISVVVFHLRCHRVAFNDGSQQGFDLSLHMSTVVLVTRGMRSELLF